MATLTSTAVPSSPVSELVEKYETYLRGQRGLSDNTVRVYLTDWNPFFATCPTRGRLCRT